MNRFRRFLLLVTLVITSSLAVPAPAKAQDAATLHWAAWDSALAVADNDPAQRYAFYAYRTLAVPHPEVYLQADAVFSTIVENMPGSRVAFRGANVRDMDLFRRLLNGEQQGPSFNWKMWVPMADSIYDASQASSATSWLDRRVASAAVLLTTPSPKMSTAEGAMMRYTQRRREGEPDSALFVVIDTNGHSYLAQNGVLLSVQSGRPWDGNAATVVPALVFNERFVFYPLFDRDDRMRSPEMASLLGKLTAPSRPVVSASDSARVDRLIVAASLPDPRSLDMARIAAMGASGIEQPSVNKMWRDMLRLPEPKTLGCEEGMMRMICYRADRLSPHTAEIAALAPSMPFDSAAEIWEKEYLSRCGRLVNPRDTVNQVREAGGYLWAFELLELTFDDIIRTRAGAGSSQALAMAAILDLLGIPNMRVSIDAGDNTQPDHHWVLAENGAWQFNYGHWRRVGALPAEASRIPMIINAYGIGGRWTHLISTELYTDADPLTVSGDLTRLAVMMPSAAFRIRVNDATSTEFAKFMRDIDDDKVEWHPLPWPPTGSGMMRGALDIH